MEIAGNTAFTFTHSLNEFPAAKLSTAYRGSKDLSSFHGSGVAFEGTTVTFVQGGPVNGIVMVTATVTGTSVDRLFVNIEVTEQ